jgi:hypothetical protein
MKLFRVAIGRLLKTSFGSLTDFRSIAISALIILCIGFILYYSKQVFYYQYDPEYQENLYYHSQWNYPGSRRGISDGEIYKFVGYRLVQGENPFNINYEIPPLGKYLYGVSIHLFGNPYWLSLALYFSSIVLIYLLSKHLFKNTFYSFLVVLLFVTTPFSATETRETMLDLPLMTFYLAHVFFFTLYLNSKRLHYFLISGILLGLATGIKPGVYTPFVTVLGMGLVYLTGVGLNKSRFEKSIGKYIIAIKKKISKKRNVILNISKVTAPSVYALSVFAGYVLSYFSYFIRHPNPIPWLRLHEKPLHFYLGPESNVDRLNVLKSIFLNRYQGWWQKEPTAFGDWSLILPLGVIAAVIVFVASFRSKNRQWLYLSGLTLLFLSVNSFIPFFSRYLMPAIPLFILLIARIFKKMPYVLIILSFANIPFLVGSIATKEPKGDMQAVARFISTRAYRELYRSMDTSQRSTIPETEFIDTLEYVFESLGTREINVNLGDMKKEGGRIIFPSSVSYVTKYGEINFSPEFEFIYKKNEWKFVWKWEYLLEGYTLGDEIVVDEGEMVVSRIRDRNGMTLAERGDWKTVYVITRVMFDWSYHLNAISSVTGDPEGLIDERVRRVIPDHFPRFVGYLDPAIDDAEKKAEEIPGVSLKDAKYLIPVNRDNGEEISDMIRKLYNNRPELFYVRAVVNIKNSDGKSVPLKFDNVESEDVVLEL